MAIEVEERSILELVARLGGSLAVGIERGAVVRRVAPPEVASVGDLAPVFRATRLPAALAAEERGATLLVSPDLSPRVRRGWTHPHAAWAMACILDSSPRAHAAPKARMGEGCRIDRGAVIHDGVVLGRNVHVGANAVIGHPGFGWAHGPDGTVRAIPQLGGVEIGDDVSIGPLSTVDAGTLTPTRIGPATKIDGHVHVGHNVVIGKGCMLAAQVGLAGSVVMGDFVMVGGQAGFADHVRVGDFAKVAAKSGVIGDVPARTTVAGYPAIPRMRWLRALARLHRAVHPA